VKRTIQDIADACGVSIALVSRIINEDSTLRCRPETRAKVLKEIERTAYIPDYHARLLANNSLKAKKDIRIGYVTYKGAVLKMNAYFDRIIEGITTILTDAEYQVYRFYIDEVAQLYRRNMPLCEKKLDGLILFGEIPDDLASYLSTQTKYLSSIYGSFIENADFVGSDMCSTMNGMLDYVKSCGYTEAGLVTGGDQKRIDAIVRYASEISLHINEKYFFNALNESQKAYDAIREKLSESPPPKVICCMNDEMAIGTMNALLDGGYRVPEDVSVTGHDDILKSNYSRVPLTTVRIYKEEIGRLVTDLLLERINYKRKFPVRVMVPCELVIRKSVIKNKKKEEKDGND
jgi:HTH-type transcriptional repressor purR